MNLTNGIIIGLVQGLTEFIPVSSSGHLVIAEKILSFSAPPITVAVFVHLGTLAAVMVVYRRRLWRMLQSLLPGGDQERMLNRRLILMLILGSIPAAIAGLTLADVFEAAFSSLPLVGGMLILTGFFLLVGSRYGRGRRRIHVTGGGRAMGGSGAGGQEGVGLLQIRWWQAITVGLFQALAIFPGLSRSGTTISSGLLTGLAPAAAADFSFLLSIPTILGAAAVDVLHVGGAVQFNTQLAVATVVAALSGFVAIHLVLNAVRARRLAVFIPYCWAVGLTLLVFSTVYK